ncbi:glutamyl-tRNA reductase [Fulvitalea axinellae]|uniref:Glutamyl-tRNA reductase n=1 Tax=Fulvitalea axinellae TaxID=1182444 RepID=A0AAU9D9N1_9BACT|nr:glutamyl-tRNA reductase [Fulvitalea axinellae]
MFNNFKVVGLSFKKAPIEIREKVALDEAGCRRFVGFAKEHLGVSEVFAISTCNRTEIYYCSDSDLKEELVQLLCCVKALGHGREYSSHFWSITDHQEALRYLFRVAMGLEAKVVGDIQISNQVKRAYQWSADEGCSGPLVHRLLHAVFYTNKRVTLETAFRDGGASVAYVASEMAERHATQFIQPKILVLGIGEIGTDVCRNLTGAVNGTVYVTNRTYSKAEALAQECGFETWDFTDVENAIKSCDIIICSVARDEPFITQSFVAEMDIPGYKHFIDLSVPRSIEPEVEQVPGATLYDIDTLAAQAGKAQQKRIEAIPAVEAIIEESIADFNEWSRNMTFSPTIQRMKQTLEEIREESVARFKKNASDKEAALIDKATKAMIQKIIKLPVLQLKAACKRDDAATLIGALNDLFDLEKDVARQGQEEMAANG